MASWFPDKMVNWEPEEASASLVPWTEVAGELRACTRQRSRWFIVPLAHWEGHCREHGMGVEGIHSDTVKM